jgi:hypothetical protein
MINTKELFPAPDATQQVCIPTHVEICLYTYIYVIDLNIY